MKPFLLLSLFVLSAGSSAVFAAKPFPQGSFVCHVITVDGQDGVFFVQALDVEDAERAARKGLGIVAPGARRKVDEVVECLVDYEPEFDSGVINDLLQSLVR